MNNVELLQAAVPPFIKLLEAHGVLYGRHFVAMAMAENQLYLIQLHNRPVCVSVEGDSFYLDHKHADGPKFNPEYDQTVEEALEVYRFKGKDGEIGFKNVLVVPQTGPECELLAITLQQKLTNHEQDESTLARNVLDEAIANVNHQNTVSHQEAPANPIMANKMRAAGITPTGTGEQVKEEPAFGDTFEAAAEDLIAAVIEPAVKGWNVPPVKPAPVFVRTGLFDKLQSEGEIAPSSSPALRLFRTFHWA